MGRVVQEFLDNWGAGVITTLPADGIPAHASPRAWNTELTQAAGDRASVRKRKGIVALLDNPLSAAALLAQFYFRPRVSGVYTPMQLAYAADGSLWKITGATGTSLTAALSQDAPPEFAQAQNLALLVNGVDRLKLLSDGTTVQNFGIARPLAAPTIAAGAAGAMTGTYDVAFTFYNMVTGHESSRSDTASVTLSAKKLNVTIPGYVSTASPAITGSGGTLTTLGDSSRLHAFTAGGTFTVTGGDLTVEYLVVAGGAGGGAATDANAAGGGAGGQVLAGSATLAAGTYAITVGAAGAGGTVAGTATGATGGNATFNGLTARGGSGGGGSETDGVSGYLGGGGGATGPSNGGTGSVFNGGYGGSGGGGGGAGTAAAGGNGPNFNIGGDGGAGVYSSITGSAVGYGGGGSGAAYAAPGTASHGGGIGASYYGPGGAATALSGAGGGGGRFSNPGGAGAAGVVYLRYSAIPSAATEKVPDPQVDTVRVHIRKQATNAYLFRLNTGTGYNVTTGGWSVAYGSVALDLTDAQLEAMTALTPSTSENDRPPAGVTHLCWHNSRMFAADTTTLYYSKVALPEAFDANFFEYINPNDGQEITALKSIGGVLIIFKTHSIWGLFGDDPNNWYLRNLDPQTGCAAARSIVTVEGKTYWWSEQGPWMWTEGSDPFPLGKELIQPTVSPEHLSAAYASEVVAAVDVVTSRILFAVPTVGQTRNDRILPYNYRLGRWEASLWDPMDAASLCAFVDDDEFPFICLGNYAGELFRMSQGDTDGVDSGTVAGVFVPTASSALGITDSGAAFQANLAERRVTVVDSDGVYVGRRRIVSNTATTLVLASVLTGLTADATYTYHVGGPDFQFDTRWATFDAPFDKKRFEYGFFEGLSAAGTVLAMDLRFDYNPEAGQTRFLTLTGASTTWDAPIWDTAGAYGTSVRITERFRIGRTGRAWSLRLRNAAADTPITLYKLGMQAEMMTTNR